MAALFSLRCSLYAGTWRTMLLFLCSRRCRFAGNIVVLIWWHCVFLERTTTQISLEDWISIQVHAVQTRFPSLLSSSSSHTIKHRALQTSNFHTSILSTLSTLLKHSSPLHALIYTYQQIPHVSPINHSSKQWTEAPFQEHEPTLSSMLI